MSSKGIPSYKIRNIMEKAAQYPMDVTTIFDENIGLLIDNICASSQMPPEYLITMLLPAIGHFLNGSQIQTNTGTPTNISFFTTIIGYPSVNKSSATEAILKACLTIEKQVGIKPEESRVNSSATVESLLTEMKNTSPKLIQIWDEAVTLLQSFGLYKQGGAAYDRSIMCTLYNSSSIVKRQTKSGNIVVENPVLNIGAAAHPADIFTSITNEADEDGLMARFLFSAPRPCIPLSSEIKSLNIDEPSLTHLLYIIYCFNSIEANDARRTTDHEEHRVLYTYSENAQKVINNIFDEYTLQIRAAYGVDQGLGSILGKSKVQVSKIAGALHATALASAVFDQLTNQNHCLSYYDTTKITFDLLKQTVKNFKETHKWTLISEATAQAAVILMNYFITQKKIYTNRPVGESLDEMRERLDRKLLEQEEMEKHHESLAESRRLKISMRADDGGEQRHPEKVLLLAKGMKIPWSNIALNHGGFKAATLHNAAANLEADNLGRLSKEKSGPTGRASTFFTKVPVDPNWDPSTLAQFANILGKYNVSLKAYKTSFTGAGNISTNRAEPEPESDDNSMELSPSAENSRISPSPTVLPRTLSASTGRPITNHGFLTPQFQRRAKTTTMTHDPSSFSDLFSTNPIMSPPTTTNPLQPKQNKKNRIEPLHLPTSPIRSPRNNPLQSQEYPYEHI